MVIGQDHQIQSTPSFPVREHRPAETDSTRCMCVIPLLLVRALFYLFLGNDCLAEEMLEMLIGKVDAQLLQAVHPQILWKYKKTHASLFSVIINYHFLLQ